MGSVPEEVTFLKDRHIRYWLRCAKTFLPDQYTPNDSSRVTLAFFIVCALDLLHVLESKTSQEERQTWVDWLYHCQVPEGGFRGFTGTMYGMELRTTENRHWDPANLPATFFAILSLVVLGDDLSRVKREETLEWLPNLQRPNGSFGETLGEDGRIEGGNDLRFCCCAAGIRYVLGGTSNTALRKTADFDAEKLVGYIASCQAYDGGFGEKPYREAHSGLTYCAISALSLLGHVPPKFSQTKHLSQAHDIALEDCLRCIVSRQSTYLEEGDEEDAPYEPEPPPVHSLPIPGAGPDYVPHLGPLSLDKTPSPEEPQPLDIRAADIRFVGFNGRPNKIVDTCYSFWNVGALAILNRVETIDATRLRRYLLEKVQHMVGGFGKGVGDPPDVLHAYLGLASFSLLGSSGVQPLDPTFCISQRARLKLDRIRKSSD